MRNKDKFNLSVYLLGVWLTMVWLAADNGTDFAGLILGGTLWPVTLFIGSVLKVAELLQ
jgi:hypothetical protein